MLNNIDQFKWNPTWQESRYPLWQSAALYLTEGDTNARMRETFKRLIVNASEEDRQWIQDKLDYDEITLAIPQWLQEKEVDETQEKSKQVFRQNLESYCSSDRIPGNEQECRLKASLALLHSEIVLKEASSCIPPDLLQKWLQETSYHAKGFIPQQITLPYLYTLYGNLSSRNAFDTKSMIIIDQTTQWLHNQLSSAPLSDTLFKQLLTTLGKCRQELALASQSDDAKLFGIPRNSSQESQYGFTPFPYERYPHALINSVRLAESLFKDSSPLNEPLSFPQGYTLQRKFQIHSSNTTMPSNRIMLLNQVYKLKTKGVSLKWLEIETLLSSADGKEISLGSLFMTHSTSHELFHDVPSALQGIGIAPFLPDIRAAFFTPSIHNTHRLMHICERCFYEILTTDKEDKQLLVNKIATLHFLLARASFFYRGSAAISEWISKILYKASDFPFYRELAHGHDDAVDITALTASSLQNFMTRYLQTIDLGITSRST